MDFKSLNLKNCQTDGRQKNLPSVFPFYSPSEKQSLYALDCCKRVEKMASHLKMVADEIDFSTVCLDENLFVLDLTCCGENQTQFLGGVSPAVISAIVDAISQMELKPSQRVVLGVPAEETLLISAYVAMAMGFPIEKIVVSGERDLDFRRFSLVDTTCEELFEYVSDFYDDFDFLLGLEDAKTALALEIYTDGFNQKTLLINAFGVFDCVEDCCFALSGKKKNKKEALKWIEENCAISINCQNIEQKIQMVDKNLMKELCNLP